MDDLVHDAATARRTSDSTRAVTHPLQPLTASEIAGVIRIIRARYRDSVLFETIELLEPAKPALATWAPGQPVPRAARANIFGPQEAGVWRLTVSLDDAAITSERFVEGACAMIQPEQFIAIEQRL